ncbi:hypothetical protein [Brevundimonas sp. TWP1-2-1b1]|uniref:hypothetical protein n=1 Tax=unclassified Brevundimonas TaxID=2622653 RepID=UPI003CEA9337
MTTLTSHPAKPTDHIWFRNLVTEDGNEDTFGVRTAFKQACEEAFEALRPSLDPNFAQRFREETPEAASELLFGMAMIRAGWTLTGRTTRFDFTFTRPDFDGRVLIEVTTPAPPDRSAWEETEFDGGTLRSFDQASRDAAMTRLTGGFYEKSKIVLKAMEEGHVRTGDYRVIALGGTRISAEMHWTASPTGLPPDYAAAFLPIGSLSVPITVPRDFSEPPKAGEARHLFSATIPRGDKATVSREAFASARFPHVDAVMFSPVSVTGFATPELQSSTLHNPFSDFSGERPMLNLAADYNVAVTDEELQLTLATSRG